MKKSTLTLLAILAIAALSPLYAKESADITVFRPAVNPRDKNDVMVRAAAEYKKQTGGKVTFVISDWNNWQAKILTYMAAGEPIDVVFARDADFPKFYVKGYLQPIDKYVDLSAPNLNKAGMDMAFKYVGHYYAASNATSNHPWIIIYNKSLMEEEGIPVKAQPLALYQSGKWTWAALRDLARKLTKDTAGTGKINRWGFANWWTRGFVYMNGASFTEADQKGNFALNFDDQRVVEALTFLENAKKEGWYMQDNSIAKDGLQKRTVAMFMEREYTPMSIAAQTRDELGYVPLPFGPGNKDKKNIFETDGYGIGNGSKNPEHAGLFINICLKTWYDEDLKSRAKWPKEIGPLVKEMEKSPSYPSTSSSAIDSIMDEFLGEIVWSGKSPSTAIAGYKAKAENLVLEAGKPMEKPVRLPFSPITVDFENGDSSMFSVMYKTYKSVKVQVIQDARSIKGKSLLVSMNSSVDGEFIDALISDPNKLGVVGWRNYKISFDVKPLSAPSSKETYMSCQVYKDAINNFGWITQKLESANTVYHVEGYINNLNLNGKLPIKIGGHLSKDFVIDNIQITEK